MTISGALGLKRAAFVAGHVDLHSFRPAFANETLDAVRAVAKHPDAAKYQDVSSVFQTQFSMAVLWCESASSHFHCTCLLLLCTHSYYFRHRPDGMRFSLQHTHRSGELLAWWAKIWMRSRCSSKESSCALNLKFMYSAMSVHHHKQFRAQTCRAHADLTSTLSSLYLP